MSVDYRRFYIDGFGSVCTASELLILYGSMRAKCIGHLTLGFLLQTHASEIPDMYGGGNIADLLIHFANTLNPNGAPGIDQNWPKYNNTNPILLDFSENTTVGLTNDTYREAPIDFLIQLNLAAPWPQ